MVDILIRDVADDVLAAVDANARKLGLSRAEYLRRTLDRERATLAGPVTLDHATRFRTRTTDLRDDTTMSDAWS